MWSGERLTKRQVTSRPDHLWPELRTKLGRNAKRREKHKWAIEKPKLDNARRYEESISLTLRTRSSKKTLGMLARNRKHALQDMQDRACMERPVARPIFSSLNLREYPGSW